MKFSGKGTLCVFLSAVFFSLGGLLIKLSPWGPMALNGGRSLCAALFMGAFFLVSKRRLRFTRQVVFGALCVVGESTLFVFATKLTTAANAIVLQFTMPVFVMLFSALFFRKKPGKLDVAVCAAVLLGIVFFFVDSLSGGGMKGNALAVVSGMCYACVFMLNGMPGGDALSAIFFGMVIDAAIGLPFIPREADLSASAFLGAAALGVFQIGLGYTLLSLGLDSTPPVAASLISGVEPILNPVLVAVFYHEKLSALSLAGAAIVLVAILTYNVLRAREKSPAEAGRQAGA